MGKKVGVMSRQAPKDFAKVKNKVGKKKKAAQNETQTDFRVRQVHVPAQNALEEKGEEVTHRRLGLLELLAHMQHHSARVRRDALRGLQELCAAHDGVLGKNLARIVEATTTAAFDSHAEVRQAFRAFQSWLMQALPEGGLAAFAPALALQVRSALSHVSSEVRGDGLVLLELYVARLGESQVLTQAEALRVIKILCQMQSHSDTVLSCLHRLLQPPPSSTVLEPSQASSCSEAQMALQALLDGRFRQTGGDAGESQAGGEEMEVEAGADSPIWAFCLRMWMQSGDSAQGSAESSKGAAEAAAKPGWTKLRCAAVLEKALQASLQGASRGVALQPSAAQVATLAGIVRRGEWPVRAQGSATVRQLADSANLVMARVCALLVAGGSPPDANKYNLNLLANAVLGLVEEVASTPLPSAGAGGLAAAAATSSSGALGSDVRPLTGASAMAYALRTLDLLWACSPQAAPDGPSSARAGRSVALTLGPQEMDRLVAATAQLLERGARGEGDGEAKAVGASAVLSVPLAASLLGLRPSAAAAARPPQALRAAWPEALAAAGEPCLAGAVEASQPGTAVAWVTAWPKLLWYLGKSDPALSAFLLALLLELAKQAVRLGSLHAQLFSQVCPLLVPFLAGRPGAARCAEPPPLALLPAGPDGPQGLAAMLLHHFPKLTEPLLALLAKLVCRWSDLGTTGDGDVAAELPPARLGPECSELILQAVLCGPSASAEKLLPTRLGVAITVLTAGSSAPSSGPRAERAERAALRFADLVAGWLMDEPSGSHGPLLGRVAELSYDDRRRLAFQSLAWPLCTRVLDAGAALAPRALCFLFFCACRLPRSGAESCGAAAPAADLDWRGFLCKLFSELLAKGAGRALQPEAQGTGFAAALAVPLCEPTRGGGLPRAGSSVDPHRCLARMLVTLWMCAVAASQRAAAYELLAKLCAQRLLSLEQGAGREAAALASVGEELAAGISSVAMVLAEAIAYRNEHSLPTAAWGDVGVAAVADASLASCGAEALQARLRGALPAAAARPPHMAPGLAALEAALPLL